MLATSLVNAIVKRGGTAELRSRGTNGRGDNLGMEVVGELHGHDIHMYGERNDYFTARPIAKRGHHDPFSDYNPGGWTFWRRLKSLDYYTPKA